MALRDHPRDAEVGDPVGFAVGWQATTDERVNPYYEDTLAYDRQRLAQIECEIAGATYETDDLATSQPHLAFSTTATGSSPTTIAWRTPLVDTD